MNKTRRLLQTLLCVSVSVIAAAKQDTTRNTIFGLYYILPIEFPSVDNNAMNTQLQSMGFPTAEPPKASAGFGFQWHMNRFIINLNYNWQNRRPKSDTNTIKIRYTGVSFNVGVDVLQTARFSLYPYAGFKSCAINYRSTKKIPDSTSTLQNYFNTTLDNKEINNTRIHLDLGIGAALRSFYLINIRAGYLVPLDKSEWTISASKTTITNAPVTKYGTYITLTLGIGNLYDERQMRRRQERRREPETRVM